MYISKRALVISKNYCLLDGYLEGLSKDILISNLRVFGIDASSNLSIGLLRSISLTIAKEILSNGDK